MANKYTDFQNGLAMALAAGKAAGGANVTELTKAEYDALGDEKLTDNKLYFIKDYAESYAMNGKGMVSKVLWSGSASSIGTIITLNDNLNNYDLILLNGIICSVIGEVRNTTRWSMSTYFNSDYNMAVEIAKHSDTELKIVNINKKGYSADDGLRAVIGLKFCAATACYSTDEQIVGRWVDGKPLYQKTIKTILTHDAVIPLNGLNIIDAKGIVYTTAVGRRFLPLVETDSANVTSKIYINVSTDGTKMNVVYTPSNSNYYLNCDLYITIQYTKTTD